MRILLFGIVAVIAIAFASTLSFSAQVITPPGDLPNGVRAWSFHSGFELGGRKALGFAGQTSRLSVPGSLVEVFAPLGLFQRHWRSVLLFDLNNSDGGLVPVDTQGEYAIHLHMGHSEAYVELFIAEYSESREFIRNVRLSTWEMADGPREFGMRFKVSPEARWIEPRLVVDGTFSLMVESLSLTAIDGIHEVRMN
jgi:hypothetical protein